MTMMKTFSASEFKASALAIMRKVHATDESVLVTSHGKPLVRVESARRKAASGYGCMVDTCELVATDDDVVHFGSGEWGTVTAWDEAQRKGRK